MKKIAIFGSTGSIGLQTLQVIEQLGEEFEVVALAARSSYEVVAEQVVKYKVKHASMTNEDAAEKLERLIPVGLCEVSSGAHSMINLIEITDPDIVVNALVGAAGLRVTEATLKAGKVLGLANKDSLVVGGDLVIPLAKEGQLMPIDSEHSAIFQCLQGEAVSEVSRLWVTASGGPFRGKTREYLNTVTPAMALAHPTWNMGPKISIDSSTLVNKALEVIEAHHLFGMPFDQISVVVHPQSCVHSMVEYVDGSVKAHLGTTDMRIPIQYALSYPQRFKAPVEPLDFTQLGSLEFLPPDWDTFRCLSLGIEAGKKGGSLPVVFNAANEVAVASFLRGEIPYLGIEYTIEASLNAARFEELESLSHIEEIDAQTRIFAEDYLKVL